MRIVVLALLAGLTAPATAAPLSATDAANAQAILRNFNLVLSGNWNNNNETEGPVAIGGSMLASGSERIGFNTNSTYAPSVGGVTYGVANIYGNVTGGIQPLNGSGHVFIGGNASGTYQNFGGKDLNVRGTISNATISNAGTIRTGQPALGSNVTVQNGGTVVTSAPDAAVFPLPGFSAGFGTPLNNLVGALAALPGTAGVTAAALPSNTNNLYFAPGVSYTVNGKSYGVVTTTLANLATNQNFLGINNGTNDATFVIVTGTSNAALSTLNGNTDQRRIIWVFTDATGINFSGQWFAGAVLAPNATVSISSNLTGSYYFQSLTQGAELHWTSGAPGGQTYGFTGDLSGLGSTTPPPPPPPVPAPPALALLGLGLAALAVRRSR